MGGSSSSSSAAALPCDGPTRRGREAWGDEGQDQEALRRLGGQVDRMYCAEPLHGAVAQSPRHEASETEEERRARARRRRQQRRAADDVARIAEEQELARRREDREKLQGVFDGELTRLAVELKRAKAQHQKHANCADPPLAPAGMHSGPANCQATHGEEKVTQEKLAALELSNLVGAVPMLADRCPTAAGNELTKGNRVQAIVALYEGQDGCEVCQDWQGVVEAVTDADALIRFNGSEEYLRYVLQEHYGCLIVIEAEAEATELGSHAVSAPIDVLRAACADFSGQCSRLAAANEALLQELRRNKGVAM